MRNQRTVQVDMQVPERGVDLGFELVEGETLALLGPNGAGKSTALAVLAGLLRPRSGRVIIDGDELTGPRVWTPPHARRTALLAQEALLFPHLTVRDNVAFGPRSAGAGRREARSIADRWLAEVGATDLAARRPGALSGGQAQRVAIARALAADPRLLLLDEPMAALDVAVTGALRQLLRTVLADRTAVIVTHDVLDALLLADRVAVLEHGRIVEVGPTADVLARPRSAFAARLAGLNLVAGHATDGDHLQRDDGTMLHGTAGDPAPVAGEAAVGVFRPSAVAVHREPPGGSPRNAWRVTLTGLEPLGELVRVRAGALAADVTVASVADLGLAPGADVIFVVKATEVALYARGDAPADDKVRL